MERHALTDDRPLGPKTDAERGVYAAEAFIFDVQEFVCWTMVDHGVSNQDLADALGVSREHVRRLMSGEEEMTLRTLGHIFHALGVEPLERDPTGRRRMGWRS